VTASLHIVKAAREPQLKELHPFVTKLLSHGTLDAVDIEAVARALNHRSTVKRGKDIIVQGVEHKALYIIESGFAIRYTLVRKGGRQIINTLLPGDLIGFPAVFFDRSVVSVTALSDMSLHSITSETFVALCKRRPNIAIALIWFAARESALCAYHLVNAGRRAPLERVAHFILEMHFRLRALGQASEFAFETPLSQEGIGDALGLSAPHVNRMLGELKREELISMDGRKIKILDRTALQILAEFDPSYLVRSSFQQDRPKR
jgi:CRP-like cAMP-binding protein